VRASWLLVLFFLDLAAQGPIQVSTTIQRVRLHPDEAWITRTGTAKVPGAGSFRLQIHRLPVGLTLDDVRVQAKGPEGTSLGEIRVGSEPSKQTDTPEAKQLLARLEALHLRKTTLEAQLNGSTQAMEFLSNYQQNIAKNSSEKPFVPVALVELSRSLETRYVDLQIQNDGQRRELEKILNETTKLEGEWRTLQGKLGSDRSPSQLTLEVLTPRAGDIEIELSTRTSDARWKPSYEARVLSSRQVELTLYAAVTQVSGEAWEGVQLELSNANPNRTLDIPSFSAPPKLGWKAPAPVYPIQRGSGATVEIVASSQQVDRTSAVMVSASSMSSNVSYVPPPPPPKPVLEPSAPLIAEANGLFATYRLDGSKDVPSDGESRRFKVVGTTVAAKFIVAVAPRIDGTAYQLARFELPSNLPLFPGSPLNRFFGPQRLGQGPLVVPPAGYPMELSLGPFQGLRTQLIQLEQIRPFQKIQYTQAKKVQAGLTQQTVREDIQVKGEDRTWKLKDRFVLSNDTEQALEVEVRDRLVRSIHESIKILLSSDTTTGSIERPAMNLRAWTIRIEPRNKAEVNLGLEIHAPKDGDVSGLRELNLE
jgi:uncharacterized protein (TIGR02231 family)